MKKKICRVNNQYEFPIDFYGERITYNDVEEKYEPLLRFQTHIEEGYNDFVMNLMPLMGEPITSIEVINPNDNNSIVKLSSQYDLLVDVSTDYPMFEEQYYRGHVVFGNSNYSIEATRTDQQAGAKDIVTEQKAAQESEIVTS